MSVRDKRVTAGVKVRYLDLPILNRSKEPGNLEANKDGIYRYCDDPDGFCWLPDHVITVVVGGMEVYRQVICKGHSPEIVDLNALESAIEREIWMLAVAIKIARKAAKAGGI